MSLMFQTEGKEDAPDTSSEEDSLEEPCSRECEEVYSELEATEAGFQDTVTAKGSSDGPGMP